MWKESHPSLFAEEYQVSLLSPPLWQTQSQTPSPRGMGEVPRECWLQARRKRNRFASSSPIQNEEDVHADQEAWKKINADIKADQWLGCQSYNMVLKFTYFTEQSSEVHIVGFLQYFESQSYLDSQDNKVIIFLVVIQDLSIFVFESQIHLDS